MKKSKLITPIMSIAALTTGAATLGTLASCNNQEKEPEVTDKWYDLSKLTYTPSKQLNIEGMEFTVPNVVNTYIAAILQDPQIFKEDLVWSLQKSLNWKLQSSTSGGRTIKTMRTFKVKIDDLKIVNKLKDEQCLRFSCKYTYEMDFTYTLSSKDHDVKITGSFDIKNMPLWLNSSITSNDWRLISWDDKIYTVFYSPTLDEIKNDSSWSFTMNETGTMTERTSGKISISNYTWNKDTLALSIDKTPAISFFSTLLFDWVQSEDKQTIGEKYSGAYFVDFSYYLDNINRVWTIDEEGEEGYEEAAAEEGEAAAAEGGEEAAAAELKSSKVLI